MMHLPITLDQMRDEIQTMHAALPRFGLTPETLPQLVRVYREALEHFDRDAVAGAGKMLRRSSDKFPSAAKWCATAAEWVKHNRVHQEWHGEQDDRGRAVVCRVCRSVARLAVLARADGSHVSRLIAPCDPERHSRGSGGIVPLPENFVRWAE